ncbi:MAG: fibronectin/fibrinogen-binding protein [Clostridiales bacterium]|nr:fibronectin/fibrinogen-binding protein [Clostridiales bacterium]
MPQDAFTLRFLCEELNSIFSGGKVNRIIQPNGDEMIMTVYTGKRTEKLFISVNPASPRMGVTNTERESPLTAPNFCMLLRKHLLSATLESIELVGFDRIVKIDFMPSAEFFDSVRKTLYVELMGRYSNIILTENGRILGGNRGINMFDNGVRPLIVGKPYVFPPVGDKRLPSDKELVGLFNQSDLSISENIVKNVQGIALSTAKEIEKEYLEQYNNETRGEILFDYINNFLFNKKKNPCVVIDDGKIKDVCVFPYQLITGERQYFEQLYLAEEYYFDKRDYQKKYENKKERLSSITSTAIKKAKKRLVAITSKEKDASSAEENRIRGELLFANIYRIKPGEKECVLDNYYDGSQVKILLDENLSVSKNAENYYKKYNKQKRTLEALVPQRIQAEKELDYLNSVLDEIILAEDVEELGIIRSELESAGLIQKQNINNKKAKKESFCREYEVLGFKIRAGRNNAENDKLTFTSKPEDIWVHAKDYHSSHVVIETNGKKIPDEVLIVACEISAYYSKGRETGKTEVVFTEKKHVKKPPKSKPGFCVYDNFKSIVVNGKKHLEFCKN